MKRLLCGLLVAIALGACGERTSTLGAFVAKDAGPLDSGRGCTPQDVSALPLRLPLSGRTSFDSLPPRLPLGLLTAEKAFAHDMDVAPLGWSYGLGAYTASLSEFGFEGHAANAGWHELIVAPKMDPLAGTTDRKFWGAELSSPATFGHGLFVARVRRDAGPDIQSAFFFSNDRVSATGANLGWTGAILEFSDDRSQIRVNALFHDSASGRHDSQLVASEMPSREVVLLALLSLPGRVAFYVDGTLAHEWLDADTLSEWAFHFTHWINNPAPREFSATRTPVVFAIDFVAHYALPKSCD